MLLRENIPVYSKDHMKPINTLRGQNRELMTVKTGGAHSYHVALKS
jgi:hypothetical protein